MFEINANWYITYLNATPCLKSEETGLCSIVAVIDFPTFDYVRLCKCSISEHSIVFDWQNLGVSSIKFDYRTQSKSIERLEFDWDRLPNVRLTTPVKLHL